MLDSLFVLTTARYPQASDLSGLHAEVGWGKVIAMLKAISLFSGAGGLDIGLNSAGIHTVASVELDKHCAQTLRRNTNTLVFNDDVRTFSPNEVLASTGLAEIDVIHGGPPCQPFSQIGARKGLQHRDGLLLFEMIRWIDELRPRAFIIEQVKGVLRHQSAFDHLQRSIAALGYSLDWEMLNSVDFDVAQRRERVFLVGSRTGPARFKKHLKRTIGEKTVGCVIGDLPDPGEGVLPNHIDKTPKRDRERISFVKEGEWLSKSEAPAEIVMRLTRKDTTKFRRLAFNEPSLTLRCGEIFYHPRTDRYLTPREYMRIHGYPDRYVLEGPIRGRTGQVSNLDQHRQIANSVPPPLAKAVGEAVIESRMCHA